MRARHLLAAAASGIALAAAQPSWTREEYVDPVALSPMCATPETETKGAASSAPPKILPGFGKDGIVIVTKSPEAQRWFDYGLRLARAFQHQPAKDAFAEAARLDPDCTMCAWGQALGDGPTINYGINAAERAQALKHALRAQGLATSGNAPERDRLLIAAMVRRYAEGDAAYAKAMEALAARWPNDEAILLLTAEAQMIGWKDKGLKRAVVLLEQVLAANPDHVGAIHFYIHATEGVDTPEKAVSYADRLKTLAPAASHLIHMPSHTYYRVGRYRDAAQANLDAITADDAWVQATGWGKDQWQVPAEGGWNQGLWELPYYGHNVRFALGGALMAGEGDIALRIARHYQSQPGSRTLSAWEQSNAGAAWAAWGRFGEPEAVLAMAEPGSDRPFLRAMRHYARGEVFARRGDAAAVRAEAALIKPSGDKSLKVQMEIAREILLGRAAMIDGAYAVAAKHYRKAAERQEAVLGNYGDPPTWWYPVRRSLAAALLANGQTARALAEANAVLEHWKDDPMALLVVSRAESELGRTAASHDAMTKARLGWSGEPLAGVAIRMI